MSKCETCGHDPEHPAMEMFRRRVEFDVAFLGCQWGSPTNQDLLRSHEEAMRAFDEAERAMKAAAYAEAEKIRRGVKP